MLSPSRTTSSRRSDPMVLGTVKLMHWNSTISPSTRGRDVAKELTARKNITKEFTVVFYEIKKIVIRNSELAGPSRSASKWISWWNWDTSKSWWSSWVQFIFLKLFVAVGFVCSWWQSSATDGVCKQYTSYVTFSHAVNTHYLLHITLHGSRMCWCASCHLHGHPRCAVVRSLTLCSSPCSFPCVSPILSSSTCTLSWTSSSMWSSSGQYTTGTPPKEESGPLVNNAPLTGYEPNQDQLSGTDAVIDVVQTSDADLEDCVATGVSQKQHAESATLASDAANATERLKHTVSRANPLKPSRTQRATASTRQLPGRHGSHDRLENTGQCSCRTAQWQRESPTWRSVPGRRKNQAERRGSPAISGTSSTRCTKQHRRPNWAQRTSTAGTLGGATATAAPVGITGTDVQRGAVSGGTRCETRHFECQEENGRPVWDRDIAHEVDLRRRDGFDRGADRRETVSGTVQRIHGSVICTSGGYYPGDYGTPRLNNDSWGKHHCIKSRDAMGAVLCFDSLVVARVVPTGR